MTFNARRAAGTPLTEEQRKELQALAAMPDDQINFKDIPERFYDHSEPGALPLEDHTVTLRVDAEVAEWLQSAAKEDPGRINSLLKRAAHRSKLQTLTEPMLLDKAS